ncbi:hypothetical protein [Methylophaga sp.]|uniref:hypothetical protein n=1 Tax=Methylophaga sp. TaxID=2024840 RepID=UPI003A935F5A
MNHAQPPLHIQECPSGGFYVKSQNGTLGIVYDINNANLFAVSPNLVESANNLLNQLEGMKANVGPNVSVPIEEICKESITELKHTLSLLNRKPSQMVMP